MTNNQNPPSSPTGGDFSSKYTPNSQNDNSSPYQPPQASQSTQPTSTPQGDQSVPLPQGDQSTPLPQSGALPIPTPQTDYQPTPTPQGSYPYALPQGDFSTPPPQGSPYYPPGTPFPGQNQRSNAALTGLILGIVALLTSWIPLINWFSFILAAVGLVFAIVGTMATIKGPKTGKGMAITSIVLNALSLIIVIIAQIIIVAIARDITNDYYDSWSYDYTWESSSEDETTPKEETNQEYGQEDNSAQEEAASEENNYDLTVGTTIEVNNGLSVTVDSVETLTNYDGTPVLGVQVTYVNNSSEIQSYNSWDWDGEDGNGARESGTIYISFDDNDDNERLSSGKLAVGGSKSGYLYFEADTEKILYSSSLFSDEPIASWLVG